MSQAPLPVSPPLNEEMRTAKRTKRASSPAEPTTSEPTMSKSKEEMLVPSKKNGFTSKNVSVAPEEIIISSSETSVPSIDNGISPEGNSIPSQEHSILSQEDNISSREDGLSSGEETISLRENSVLSGEDSASLEDDIVSKPPGKGKKRDRDVPIEKTFVWKGRTFKRQRWISAEVEGCEEDAQFAPVDDETLEGLTPRADFIPRRFRVIILEDGAPELIEVLEPVQEETVPVPEWKKRPRPLNEDEMFTSQERRHIQPFPMSNEDREQPGSTWLCQGNLLDEDGELPFPPGYEHPENRREGSAIRPPINYRAGVPQLNNTEAHHHPPGPRDKEILSNILKIHKLANDLCKLVEIAKSIVPEALSTEARWRMENPFTTPKVSHPPRSSVSSGPPATPTKSTFGFREVFGHPCDPSSSPMSAPELEHERSTVEILAKRFEELREETTRPVSAQFRLFRNSRNTRLFSKMNAEHRVSTTCPDISMFNPWRSDVPRMFKA